MTWSTDAVITKQQKTALNMAKFIQAQSLLLLEKLNELDLDAEADMCEKLHEDAEMLCRTLSVQLNALQDAVNGKNIDQ
nr:Rop family plasmid primer RNA-binding protein [Enterobacter quasiroggenkampii]